MMLSLCGCKYNGYKGKHKDLYTVAINSILWNNGYSYGADFIIDSTIEILEIDSVGRVLFIYHEKYYRNSDISFSALIISQYNDSKNVYYYEGINYIIKKQQNDNLKIGEFEESEKTKLKEQNDWNKNLILDKCVKKKIDNVKESCPLDEKKLNNEIVNQISIYEDFNMVADLLTYDSNRNAIVYGSIYKYDSLEYVYFLVFINAKMEFIDFVIVENEYDYIGILKNFKIKNNWKE